MCHFFCAHLQPYETIEERHNDVVIRRYLKGKLLGKGGFAKAYLATCLQTQKQYAIKVCGNVSVPATYRLSLAALPFQLILPPPRAGGAEINTDKTKGQSKAAGRSQNSFVAQAPLRRAIPSFL
jgi:hypothetical protein